VEHAVSLVPRTGDDASEKLFARSDVPRACSLKVSIEIGTGDVPLSCQSTRDRYVSILASVE